MHVRICRFILSEIFLSHFGVHTIVHVVVHVLRLVIVLVKQQLRMAETLS